MPTERTATSYLSQHIGRSGITGVASITARGGADNGEGGGGGGVVVVVSTTSQPTGLTLSAAGGSAPFGNGNPGRTFWLTN